MGAKLRVAAITPNQAKRVMMLVLSRQKGERIMIGDDIVVTVIEIRGCKVRIGITAPKSISAHREEVWKAIRGATLEIPPAVDGVGSESVV